MSLSGTLAKHHLASSSLMSQNSPTRIDTRIKAGLGGFLTNTTKLIMLLVLASMAYIVGLAWNDYMREKLASNPNSSRLGYAASVTGIAIGFGLLFSFFGVHSKFGV